MKKKVYLFSGLGADKRAFQNLQLKEYEVNYIEWLLPEKREAINHYAYRISKKISGENIVFIGLSFGGIIALETAKYINPEKVIIISSIKNKNEIPFYYKTFKGLKLYKLIPGKLVKTSNFILEYLFGVKGKEDRKLLKEIVKDTDPCFFKWALEKIIYWDNLEIVKNTYHIHGTKDRLFPLKYLKNYIAVKGGGHFMIINKSEEISKYVNSIINL